MKSCSWKFRVIMLLSLLITFWRARWLLKKEDTTYIDTFHNYVYSSCGWLLVSKLLLRGILWKVLIDIIFDMCLWPWIYEAYKLWPLLFAVLERIGRLLAEEEATFFKVKTMILQHSVQSVKIHCSNQTIACSNFVLENDGWAY